MYFIDTHAHLNFKEFENDYKEVIDRAQKNGVKKIIIPGTDPDNALRAVEIADQFEGVYATIGAHPTHLKGGFSLEMDDGMPPSLLLESYNGSHSHRCSLREFSEMAQDDKIVAIGEIGLDYKEDPSRPIVKSEIQRAALSAIIDQTKDLNKPYILHCRSSKNSDNAFRDLHSLLHRHLSRSSSGLRGVIHCYTGNYQWYQKFRELDFIVSFTGLITLTDDFDQTIERVPLKDMLIETDCPYLSPKNSENERSEPIDVIAVAEKIARVKNISIEKVAQSTSRRAEELFGI